MTSVFAIYFALSSLKVHTCLRTCEKFKLAKDIRCIVIILAHDVQSNEVISNTEFVTYIIKCHINKKLWTMHGHIQL